MSKHLLTAALTLAAIAVLVATAAGGADTTTPTSPPPSVPEFAKRLPDYKSGDPVFAFNGKDLEGWYTYLNGPKFEDPDHVFTVTADGMLRISGQGFGGVTTKRSFKDYHLVAEWKWGDKTWDVPDPAKPGQFLASARRRATRASWCMPWARTARTGATGSSRSRCS